MTHPEIHRLIASPAGSLLGRLLEAAPVGVSLGVDGKIVYANTVCALMFGYSSPSEMLDKSFFGMIAPECHEFVYEIWRARDGEFHDPWSYELKGLRADGTVFPYRISSLTLDVPGGGKGTFAFFEDLSEDRPGESELERRAEVLRAMLGE